MNKKTLLRLMAVVSVIVIIIITFAFSFHIASSYHVYKKPGKDSAMATALCRDGIYSYSLSRGGTCSGHDGVQEWLIK